MTFESLMRRTISGVALTAALAVAPLAAQEAGTADQSAQSSDRTSQSEMPGQSGEQLQPGQSLAPDAVVATVGGTDIVGADVVEFISTLPPRMREQPPQILLSMAVEQKVLRELLLQEAQAQNLAEDPRVTEAVEQDAQLVQEDAMVAIYLQDQLSERVSETQVQHAYEQVQSQTGDDQSLPPLDALRPQIEQQLQQRAIQSLRDELVEGGKVVFYGDGESSSQSGNESSGSSAGSTEGDSSTSGSQ